MRATDGMIYIRVVGILIRTPIGLTGIISCGGFSDAGVKIQIEADSTTGKL
jgi:hypothetical protein